jgi:hypothetical protein
MSSSTLPNRNRFPRKRIAVLVAAIAIMIGASAATAQIGGGTIPGAPSWIGALLLGASDMSSDGAGAEEELPGLGHKFELYLAMNNAQDPQNPTNDVISVDTSGGAIGVALRNMPPGIKIAALDHQINVKYFFPVRTCAGGSPRIQLAVDRNGDGQFDGNAFGYVGHAPFGTGCVVNEWDVIDMTDNIGRWDLSQLGGGMTMTWDQAEAFVTATYPNHQVLSGSLVDDSALFAPGAAGRAYYDLLTIENRTLEQRQDTVRK